MAGVFEGFYDGQDWGQAIAAQWPGTNGEVRCSAGLDMLSPGVSGTVTFTVTAHDLASWDTTSNNWIAGVGSMAGI